MQRPAFLAAALLTLASAATAQAQSVGPMMVADAWSRPAVQGTNAVGYMVVMNHGGAPGALVKVDSPVVRKAEMHRSSMANGVMTMSAQPRVEIPAGSMVSFAPGGYHLMFFGLKKTLKAGDRLPATLTFEGGRRLKVEFAVSSGATPPAQDHMDHMGH